MKPEMGSSPAVVGVDIGKEMFHLVERPGRFH